MHCGMRALLSGWPCRVSGVGLVAAQSSNLKVHTRGSWLVELLALNMESWRKSASSGEDIQTCPNKMMLLFVLF